MRHRFGNAKLKRDVGSRNSLFKNLTTSVIEEERVITTVPKAKAVQPLVENMITLAKRDTLHTASGSCFSDDPEIREEAVRHFRHTLRTAHGRIYADHPSRTPQGRWSGRLAMLELVGSGTCQARRG